MNQANFFPLDKQLGLRKDQWSIGIARIATRQGLTGKSFRLASENLTDAIGCLISKDCVREMTQEWGRFLEKEQDEEVAALFSQEEYQLPKADKPLAGQASLSTDGGMVHIKDIGWKEVKMTTVSAVRIKKEGEKSKKKGKRRYAPYEKEMMLYDHSYRVGWWDAEQAMKHQLAEAHKRDIAQCPTVSAVADGAIWIENITRQNFPDMPQIIDWYHLAEKVWYIARSYFKDEQEKAAWAESRLNELWHGDCEKAVAAMEQLPKARDKQVQSAVGFFGRHQDRMDYPKFRMRGLPLGSGVVESGINTVVHHRLKTQGQGWHENNINPMLAGLGSLHSGRFVSDWSRFATAH